MPISDSRWGVKYNRFQGRKYIRVTVFIARLLNDRSGGPTTRLLAVEYPSDEPWLWTVANLGLIG